VKILLRNILRNLKLHESAISMLLGALVIVVMGIIVVNYFRGVDEGSIVPENSTAQPVITQGEGSVEYSVGEGETLWSIAEKQYGSGYNWVDIAMTNNLVNPNQISVDQVLIIPDVESKLATVTAESSDSEAISGATYTVVRGDDLWNIAVRAYGDGYKWVEIARENSIITPGLIHPGNELVLPR